MKTRGRWPGSIALLAAMLAFVAPALAVQDQQGTAMVRYDVDSATATYCRVNGLGSSPFLGGISGAGKIKTSGSSATVVSNTASGAALTGITARDVIAVSPVTANAEPFGAGNAAVVTAVASVDSITVDPAVDWSAGYQYVWWHTVCGTTANDGWIDVSNSTRTTISIMYSQGDLDTLDWRFECKSAALGNTPIVVYPSEGDGCGNDGTQSAGYCHYATAAATAAFTWEEFGGWSACRIAVKYGSTDTSDAAANLERVSGSIVATKGAN